MIKLLIDNIDKSNDLNDGSLAIVDQIQNKANTCNFSLNAGADEPSKFQEVLVYDTVRLVSASGVDVIIQDKLASNTSILTYGKFRVGQFFWLDINEINQERVIISKVEKGAVGQINITLENAIINSHSSDEDCGRLIFGGNISNLTKENPKLLTDVDYKIQCTDFTKIFDHKLINDSWEDVDVRYVINDFLNTTVNLNRVIDDMEYDNDTEVQAEWIESGDGDNPTLNETDVLQGISAIDFNWTNAGGIAIFSATPIIADYSELTNTPSGMPTEGNLTFWYKRSSGDISNITIKIGSSSVNYAEMSFMPEVDEDYHFINLPLGGASITGTPDWTKLNYISIEISETTSGIITIDDIRITAENSFKPTYIEKSVIFEDVRASFKKPTIFTNKLFTTLSWYWYIDYEYNIHGFDKETNDAPFQISDTSDNFDELKIDVDTSQVKNRQVVRGGVKTSNSAYSQVFEGDNASREWILKSKFSDLSILIDNNSSTDITEVGTTTTNITATAHGLETGDYITNRTRSNAVRSILKIDNDNFTVGEIVGQVSGDTFSKFSIPKTVGVENLIDETTVDYVSNYNEKSVRATDSEATLTNDDFILFTYHEEIPIRVQMTDTASIISIKALIGGDGVFDGAVITDNSIDSTQGARDRGQAEINAYSNPIITVKLKTNHEGLESGQILKVSDTNKNIDDSYIIQKVKVKYKRGVDFPEYTITASSSLFGLIEYFQMLSEQDEERLVDSEETIDQIFTESVIIAVIEDNKINIPDHSVNDLKTITITPSNTTTERDISTDPYKWQPDTSDTRWNLFQWK